MGVVLAASDDFRNALFPGTGGREAPVGSPRPVAVDDRVLDDALHRVIGRIGTVVSSSARDQTRAQDARILTWRARTLEIRLRVRTAEAARLLAAAAAQAGGEVLSRGPFGMRIGLRRDGDPLPTHDIHFIPLEATGRVAIIFDDAGASLEQLDAIIALGRPVTIAVLPGLRFSREVARRAAEAGLEVLLHLPVEPENGDVAMGPGGITTGMSDVQIAETVLGDLAQVPGAIGINNHMGSRGTADERVMRAVLGVAQAKGLIFVDSVTTSRSVGARLAGEMRVKAASRAVFLDNENEAAAIRAQLRRLITLAGSRGEVVAIGHAQRLTAQVLQEMLAEFDRAGVELVPISALTR